MRSLGRDLYLGVGLIGCLMAAVWGAIEVTSRTVENLLVEDARAEGRSWAQYLAGNIPDLPEIAAGAAPSAATMEFFARAQNVGDVFLYKIFDSEGRLRLASDRLEEAGNPAQEIAKHNPTAAAAVLRGEPVIEAKAGEPPLRPRFYAEAYVPVVRAGAVAAIVEVYVDQAAKRAGFRADLASAAFALASIVAAAFAIPALGLYFRTRQKHEADERADFLAHYDPLTGLLNRTSFMAGLEEALASAQPFAIHLLDVNRFKEANDALGHAGGDELLNAIADRLHGLAGPGDMVARLDGDEFALATFAADEAKVETLGQKLAASLSEPYFLSDQRIDITVCAGTAIAPKDGSDAPALMKSADIALRHAKAEGARSHHLFRAEMDSELKARRDLEALLRRALFQDGFELQFQPFHRVDDGLAGFEALLRLPLKDGGYVRPDVFVPVAEQMGLIDAIGSWVLRRGCEVAARWPQHLVVAVNLSPIQFEDGRLCERVREALALSGLPPHRLELEITEGLLLGDSDHVLAQLAEVKALGVRIAMDDFGTGYSSLSYLWKFPFDKLKIDQSFVRALGVDDHVSSIVEAIVALGRSLHLTVTAEGVETEAQRDRLRALGCHLLQGYLFGRPTPTQELPALILRDFQAGLERAPGPSEARQAAQTG
ncbi:putative bifunctional diguanylate cyclase/phosphodiesterase [Propylenella binzhouense]|uniref:EAL domain-containing protein n=1 Tax=Propylenella binzhouense TaxID=2555902 RepID=A0A964T308_9HYPH|nr:EAL domain-containing protein [Propylenella binzhouense]MYZ47503.1 EAL domain-containing protein [Propylenella binzhouense]